MAGTALGGLVARSSPALALTRRESAGGAGHRSFVSAPGLRPPAVEVTAAAGGTASGLVFVAPFALGPPAADAQYGPLIVDDAGEPVWFLPVNGRSAMNLRVQRFHGEPVLTWYEGNVASGGYGYGGECVIADTTYREVARVKAGHDLQADLHEFLITSRNTALVAIFNQRPWDLSAVGGPAEGQLVEGVVQEIDVATKEVLFEWHSVDHVGLDETYRDDLVTQPNFDYFHLNSIGVDADGDLIVSARHTSTVYKIDRRSGAVVWRLGGRKSDFALGPGARFDFQHDARRHEDGTLTVFDNGAWGPGPGDVEPSSRGLRLALDEQARTADLVAEYRAPAPRLATAMGDVQGLPGGNVFVGWGIAGSFSELGPSGDLRFDARFADGSASYRAFRDPWVGRPATRPAIVVTTDESGRPATVHASWNGATEVAHWQLRTGPAPGRLRAVRTAPRTGFETAIDLPAPAAFLAVVALDASGRQLATTKVAHLA
ncbi:MAG TPA: arylsulfotransferase family protein [Gaiellaceae bacterium]|nr:arylsulfotransferase family protein [Gaiellaceae bacterium]